MIEIVIIASANVHYKCKLNQTNLNDSLHEAILLIKSTLVSLIVVVAVL